MTVTEHLVPNRLHLLGPGARRGKELCGAARRLLAALVTSPQGCPRAPLHLKNAFGNVSVWEACARKPPRNRGAKDRESRSPGSPWPQVLGLETGRIRAGEGREMTKVALLANSKDGVRQGPCSYRANDPGTGQT